MLRVVVSTAQSGMALRSFRRAAPPCTQRFSAINRVRSTLGGCVERMNVWRACGWRGRFQVVCPVRTEPGETAVRPLHSPSRPPARAAPICTCLARSTTSPRDLAGLQTLRQGAPATTGRHVVCGVSDTAWPDAVHGLVLPISRGLRSRSLWNGSHCDDDEQRRVW